MKKVKEIEKIAETTQVVSQPTGPEGGPQCATNVTKQLIQENIVALNTQKKRVIEVIHAKTNEIENLKIGLYKIEGALEFADGLLKA